MLIKVRKNILNNNNIVTLYTKIALIIFIYNLNKNVIIVQQNAI